MQHIIYRLNEDVRITEITKHYNNKLDPYMHRAIVRMLYTTGLRNAELRNLKPTDINLDKMTGITLGKGNKHGFFTFNTKCRKMLISYLNKREELYPNVEFAYLFSTYITNPQKPISATCLNRYLKEL